jgi:hypothetical protein
MTLLNALISIEIIIDLCDGCVYGKHHCTPFPLSGGSHAKKIIGLVHIDLCDPMATSHEGAKDFLTFIDDFSKKTIFYTMKIKFNVLDKLKVFKALIENQIKKTIKVIKCDGGGEYNFKKFNTLCKENGIVKEITILYMLEQNGVIEKKNQILTENV